MADEKKFLLISRGGPGDRQETTYDDEAEARQHFDDNRSQGRGAWLYGEPDADGLRKLLSMTSRAL